MLTLINVKGLVEKIVKIRPKYKTMGQQIAAKVFFHEQF